MTRIFWDGAETGDTSFWTGGTGVVVSSPVRSGAYAYRCKGVFFAPREYLYKSFTAVGEGYWRIGLRYSATQFSNTPIRLRNGSTNICQIGYNGTYLTLYIGDSLVATGITPLNSSKYYRLELRLKIDDSAGFAQLKLDGLLEIDYQGDTKPDANTTVDNLYITSIAEAHDLGDTYFDDLAMNDTSGADDNSWCGEGKIIAMIPSVAGDTTQLTPSAGSNYACVDERPPNDDTDYVEGSTVDNYDLYHLTDSGLASDDTINRICVTARARDTIAEGGELAIGLKTGGSEYWGDDAALSTNYATKRGTEYKTNPKTSGVWTKTDLDELQAGVKVR